MKKLLLVFLVVSACSASPPAELTKVSGISRILMHEPGHYTFLVEHSSGKVGQLEIHTGNVAVTMLRDLELDEPTRIEILCRGRSCKPLPKDFSTWRMYPSTLTIHLSSTKDVDGAGWNHGKFGRGQTVVIQ